jgi:hypothetical protein
VKDDTDEAALRCRTATGEIITIKRRGYLRYPDAEAALEAALHAIAAVQAEQGDLTALYSLLFNGALGRGVTLTQAECCILYEITQGTRKYKRRGAPAEWKKVATLRGYCLLLELDGMAVEPAVAKTIEIFGVSRSAVFAARKQPWRFPEMLERLSSQTPAMRQKVREFFEAKAVDFRSGKKRGSAKKSK